MIQKARCNSIPENSFHGRKTNEHFASLLVRCPGDSGARQLWLKDRRDRLGLSVGADSWSNQIAVYPQLPLDTFRCFLDGFCIRHVEWKNQRLPARFLHLAARGFQPISAARNQAQVSAACGKLTNRGAAHPGRCPRNHGNLWRRHFSLGCFLCLGVGAILFVISGLLNRIGAITGVIIPNALCRLRPRNKTEG